MRVVKQVVALFLDEDRVRVHLQEESLRTDRDRRFSTRKSESDYLIRTSKLTTVN